MTYLVMLFALSVCVVIAFAVADLYNRANAKSVADNIKRLGKYLGIGPIP